MKLATTPDGKPRPFWSIAKVAKALDLHRDTVVRKIQRGELTAVRLGLQTLRVPVDELERYLQRQREGREYKPETVSKFIPNDESETAEMVGKPARVRKGSMGRIRKSRRV